MKISEVIKKLQEIQKERGDIEVMLYSYGEERAFIQKFGRTLRAGNPIQYILYYKNTREEELVRKWMENYNKDLIKVIYKPDDL